MHKFTSLLGIAALASGVVSYPSGYVEHSATIPAERVRRVGRVNIPHRVRQVIPDDESSGDFDVLHRESHLPRSCFTHH
jgi:hypothetical protein